MKVLQPDEMESTIQHDPDILIVDIRDAESYRDIRFPSKKKVNIPFTYLDERLDEIPKSTSIIVACHSGKQALTAGPYLKGKGYDVDRSS